MKQLHKIFLCLLAVMALNACDKKDDNYDPSNPANYYNQPPLGKDTVWATAKYVDIDRAGYLGFWLTDDANGAAYDVSVGKSPNDYGRCYLLSKEIIGSQSIFRKDTDTPSLQELVVIQKPNPMNFAVIELSDYNIKLTIGVKKVYIKITDQTIINFYTFSVNERDRLLQPDSATRASTKELIQNSLYKIAGPDIGSNYCQVKPYFQRR